MEIKFQAPHAYRREVVPHRTARGPVGRGRPSRTGLCANRSVSRVHQLTKSFLDAPRQFDLCTGTGARPRARAPARRRVTRRASTPGVDIQRRAAGGAARDPTADRLIQQSAFEWTSTWTGSNAAIASRIFARSAWRERRRKRGRRGAPPWSVDTRRWRRGTAELRAARARRAIYARFRSRRSAGRPRRQATRVRRVRCVVKWLRRRRMRPRRPRQREHGLAPRLACLRSVLCQPRVGPEQRGRLRAAGLCSAAPGPARDTAGEQPRGGAVGCRNRPTHSCPSVARVLGAERAAPGGDGSILVQCGSGCMQPRSSNNAGRAVACSPRKRNNAGRAACALVARHP